MSRRSQLLLLVAGTSVAALVTCFSTGATAATTARAHPRWTDGDIACTDTSVAICMNANNSNLGWNVKGYDYTQGNNQDMNDDWQTTDCGSGLVTETCPFTSGDDLNSEFVGDRIVLLSNHATGWIYAEWQAEVITETSGDGQLWVQVDDPTLSSFGEWINVAASDASSGPGGPDPIMVCTNGDGADLSVIAEYRKGSVPASCEWDEVQG